MFHIPLFRSLDTNEKHMFLNDQFQDTLFSSSKGHFSDLLSQVNEPLEGGSPQAFDNHIVDMDKIEIDFLKVFSNHLFMMYNTESLPRRNLVNMSINKNEVNHSNDVNFNKLIENDKQPDSEQGKVIPSTILLHQALEVVYQVLTKKNIIEKSPEILKLLERWKAVPKYQAVDLNISQQGNRVKSQEMKLWEQLVERYEQRSETNGRHSYSVESKITPKEVGMWLKHIIKGMKQQQQLSSLNRKEIQEFSEGIRDINWVKSRPNTMDSLPISKLEQYVLHLETRKQGTVEQIGKQIINKIQQVIQAQSFMSQISARRPLSFVLQPENLGEMFLRFTQINGETIVKIIVTTQTAQKALEANIHQLKHLFSPHQISIERQEISMSSLEEIPPKKEKDNDEAERHKKDQHGENQPQEQESDDFEEQLKNRLWMEKA